MKIFFIIVAILLILYFVGYFAVTACNYRFNSKVEKTGAATYNRIINDQNEQTGHSFRYGLHPASFNACEAIAVHNVKVLLKKESKLPDIIRQFQMKLGMVGYGIGGSNVYLIGKILRKNGISNHSVKLKDINKNGIYIISFFNDGRILRGIHTVALAYDGAAYTIYNLYGHSVSECDNLDFARKYVCGYCIENK